MRTLRLVVAAASHDSTSTPTALSPSISMPLTTKSKLPPGVKSILAGALDAGAVALISTICGDTLYGWTTLVGGNGSLMNIETITVNVLALGADGQTSMGAAQATVQSANHTNSQFQSSSGVVSSGGDRSSAPGTITYHAPRKVAKGPQTVDFLLRAPKPVGEVAQLEVVDKNTGQTLAGRKVQAKDLASGNRWTKISLGLNVTNANNSLKFRIHWPGNSKLDSAYVQLR